MARELDVTGWREASEGQGGDTDDWVSKFMDAVDSARLRGEVTHLTRGGKALASVVPVEVLSSVISMLESTGKRLVEASMAVREKAG